MDYEKERLEQSKALEIYLKDKDLDKLFKAFESYLRAKTMQVARKYGLEWDELFGTIWEAFREAALAYDKDKHKELMPLLSTVINFRILTYLQVLYKQNTFIFFSELKEDEIESGIFAAKKEIIDKNEIENFENYLNLCSLKELNERKREILRMFFIDNLSMTDISKEIELDDSWINQLIQKALSLLAYKIDPNKKRIKKMLRQPMNKVNNPSNPSQDQ